jgi:hypothetical protein
LFIFKTKISNIQDFWNIQQLLKSNFEK